MEWTRSFSIRMLSLQTYHTHLDPFTRQIKLFVLIRLPTTFFLNRKLIQIKKKDVNTFLLWRNLNLFLSSSLSLLQRKHLYLDLDVFNFCLFFVLKILHLNELWPVNNQNILCQLQIVSFCKKFVFWSKWKYVQSILSFKLFLSFCNET